MTSTVPPPVAASGAVRVRRAATGDLDGLCRLEAVCFADGERWSADGWRTELDGAGDRVVFVAARARRAAGDGCQLFDEVVAACCFHAAGEDAELYRVMTDPALRGLGLATMLVTAGLAWAHDQGAVRVLLEVRHDNVNARSLYADLGFSDLYLRTNYYAFGQDAVVMSRPLGGPPGAVVAPAPADAPAGVGPAGGLWADLHARPTAGGPGHRGDDKRQREEGRPE